MLLATRLEAREQEISVAFPRLRVLDRVAAACRVDIRVEDVAAHLLLGIIDAAPVVVNDAVRGLEVSVATLLGGEEKRDIVLGKPVLRNLTGHDPAQIGVRSLQAVNITWLSVF